MALDLRPLTLGELLDRSFWLFRRHFGLFVGLMAVPSVITLFFGVVLLVFPEIIKDPQRTGSEPDPATIALFAVVGILGFTVFMIVYWVAYMITLGATTAAVSELYVGRTATIVSSYARVRGMVGKLALVTLLIALRVLAVFIVSFAVAAVVGIVLAIALGPLAMVLVFAGTMAGMLACFVYSLRFSVAVPALVLEQVTAADAVRRSVDLTKDNLGRTAVILVFALIITYATLALFQAPFTVAAVFAGPESSTAFWLNMIGTFTGTIAGAISGPLMIIALALLYYDLRIRKEGLDLAIMMANLDSDGAPPAPPLHVPTTG